MAASDDGLAPVARLERLIRETRLAVTGPFLIARSAAEQLLELDTATEGDDGTRPLSVAFTGPDEDDDATVVAGDGASDHVATIVEITELLDELEALVAEATR